MMTDQQPNLTEALTRLAVPFGLHLTYTSEDDTMKVSGNLDHANADHIALAAGMLGAEMRIEKWSECTDQSRVVLLFTQYIIAVLRGFANQLENRDVFFSGSTKDGLLVITVRDDEKAREPEKDSEPDPPLKESAD